MKHRTIAVAATVAVLATTGGTYALAADDDPGPGSTTTTKVDETDTIPKGYSCDVKVKLHYVGTETTAIALDGQTVTSTSPDETVRVTNVETHKSVKRTIDGSFVVYSQKDKGRSLKVYGFGRNVVYGAGFKGLPFFDGGVQRFTVTGAGTKDETGELTSLRGGSGEEELCKAIGAKPVQGKTAPSDDASTSARRMPARMG